MYLIDTKATIYSLPDKVLICIFQYLKPYEILVNCGLVCAKWKNITRSPEQWKLLRLREGFEDTFKINNEEDLNKALNWTFSRIEYIELPGELISTAILNKIFINCHRLTHLTLDFSNAIKLHDFNELNENTNCKQLKSFCLYLNDTKCVLDGLIRKVYSLHLLTIQEVHLIGKDEQNIEEDELIETISINKLRSFMDNLRVINLYKLEFIQDYHIEALSLSCKLLECVGLSYCSNFKGYSLKNLIEKCGHRLETLILQNTSLENEAILNANWSLCKSLNEVDLTSTDLNEETMLYFLASLPCIVHLSVAYCDGFTNLVLNNLDIKEKLLRLKSIDIQNTPNLSIDYVYSFIFKYGHQLNGFAYVAFNSRISQQFWLNIIPLIGSIRILIFGTSKFNSSLPKMHINLIIDKLAKYCPLLERLQISYDPEFIVHSNQSRLFIDRFINSCSRLKSLTMPQGDTYELLKFYFKRSYRFNVVRSTNEYLTCLVCLFKNFNRLQFC
jgi:hypothetical protein